MNVNLFMSHEKISPKLKLHSAQKIAVSHENIKASKAEKDALRRELMDKKAQIQIYEQQCTKLEEVKTILYHLVLDYVENQKIPFPKIDQKELDSFPTCPHLAINFMRRGIDNLIKYHESLAGRFEIEYAKHLFIFEEQLKKTKDELKKEEEKINISQEEVFRKQNILSMLCDEKLILMKTIQMRRSTLNRHVDTNVMKTNQRNRSLESTTAEMKIAEDALEVQKQRKIELDTRLAERKLSEQKQTEKHNEILNSVQSLRAEFQTEAYRNNLTQSELDKAKLELVRISRSIESFHDNLKTQELLDAEVENKRLRSVVNIEKIDFENKLKYQFNKGKDLENRIVTLTSVIEKLNMQIGQTEQKLQTQMMKIPDFKQLHLALDRLMAQNKKYHEFVLKRKYILDEIREKNRQLEMMEIQDSKDRMAQLRITMPIDEGKKDEEYLLPLLIEERQKQNKELEELLTFPGF